MLDWETADENPSAAERELEFARIWKQLPKIVFSTTLERVEGNARLVSAGVAEEVARLKAQPGKDLAVGGAGLAASLARLGLIDEYRLFVSPVVLGGGTRFFPALEQRIDLELAETQTFGSSVVYLRYGRRGGLTTQSADYVMLAACTYRCGSLIAGSAAWALSGAPQAGAAWTAPVKVSAADVTASAPEVGIDDAGNITVVWVSGSTARSIRSTFWPAGGDWDRRSPACRRASTATIPSSRSTLRERQWSSRTAALEPRRWSAYRAAGGFWASSVALPGSGSGSEPRVGIDDAGNAVVVWSSAGTVQSAYRPATGGWTGPTQVSPAGEVTVEPQVAMSPTGVAQAIWRHELQDNPRIRRERGVGPPAGTAPWTAARELTLPDTDTVPVAEYQLRSVYDNGYKVAVWANRTTRSARSCRRPTASRPAGVAHPLVQNASDGATSVEAPQVALDDQGHAVAVWRSYNGTGFRTQASTTATLGGTWTAPVFLADVETGLAEPQVAVAPAGNAAAVWRTSSASISAAIRPAGGAFLPATTISSIDSRVVDPRVVYSTAGDAIAAWSESTTATTRIAVSVDDPPARALGDLGACRCRGGHRGGNVGRSGRRVVAGDAWLGSRRRHHGRGRRDQPHLRRSGDAHRHGDRDRRGRRRRHGHARDRRHDAAGGTGPGNPPPGGGDPGGGDPGGGTPASTPVTLGATAGHAGAVTWAIRKAKAVPSSAAASTCPAGRAGERDRHPFGGEERPAAQAQQARADAARGPRPGDDAAGGPAHQAQSRAGTQGPPRDRKGPAPGEAHANGHRQRPGPRFHDADPPAQDPTPLTVAHGGRTTARRVCGSGGRERGAHANGACLERER